MGATRYWAQEAHGMHDAEAADDSKLIERLRAGEDDAYRDLVAMHGGRLLAVARRIMRNDDDARDCIQDAFLSAFRSIDRFEGKARLGTWLHRIVVNACLMKLRASKRRPEEPVDPQLPELDRYGFRIGSSELPRKGVDEILERSELREQVRAAIDELPDSYRIVLLLRDIEEYDTAQTAEMLAMTPGAVKVRLHRARVALREQIESLFE